MLIFNNLLDYGNPGNLQFYVQSFQFQTPQTIKTGNNLVILKQHCWIEDQMSTTDFLDTEDLIGWLLLNPEMTEFDSFPITETVLQSNEDNDNDDSSVDSSNFATGSLKRSRSDDSDDKSSKKNGGKTNSKKRQKGGDAEKDIEARVNELKKENAELQAHLTNVTQRTTEVQKQRQAMEIHMTSILQQIGEKEDADQSELEETVKQYTEIYADYGKCRQREVFESLK